MSSIEEKNDKRVVQFYICNENVQPLSPEEEQIYNTVSLQHYVGSSLNLYPLSIVLVQNGSFLDSQGYLYGNDLFLDPSKGTARLGFASEDRSVEWTYDPASVTFTGVSEKLTYKVTVSGISGASDITYSGSSDGMTAFDFSYGGNVHMDIAVSSA